MFFRQIADFERFFKALDRLNILVFNVWKDKRAESFKDAEMKHLESFYRNYISEMREQSNEMIQLQDSTESCLKDLYSLEQELKDVCDNPSIKGCVSYCAYGYFDKDKKDYGKEYFIAKYNENPEEVARQRCRQLLFIDRVQSFRSY